MRDGSVVASSGRRRAAMPIAAAAAVLLAAAGAVAAGERDYKDFFGRDDRIFVDSARFPWSAIGRLEFESGGHCTATLVAPRVILTAAHCLYFNDGTDRIDPPTVFMAGYDGGRYVASARVEDWVIANGYNPRLHLKDVAFDGFDYAFMKLDEDIGTIAGMLQIYQHLTAEDIESAIHGAWYQVDQAGYSGDLEYKLTVHLGCPMLRVFDDNTFFHQCDTLQGASGSPVFIKKEGQFEIIGVVSTISKMDGVAVHAMAVDSRAFAKDLARYLRILADGE